MADGSIIIDTKLHTKSATSQLLTLENRIVKTANKIDALTGKMEVFKNQKIPTAEYKALQAQFEKLNAEAAKVVDAAGKLKGTVPTDEYNYFQKQLDAANKKLESLYEKELKYKELGASDKQWASLRYDINSAETKKRESEQQLSDLKAEGKAFQISDELEKNSQRAKELGEQLQKVKQEMLDLEQSGKAFIPPETTEEYAKMEQKLAGFNRELDVAVRKHAEITEKQEKAAKGADKVAKNTKKIRQEADKGSGAFGKMGSKLLNLLKSVFVFSLISKAFRAMLSGLQEGLKNLAHHSDRYNKSMSEMKSSTEQLKNGLAAAFEPLISTAIPYITRFVNVLNSAVQAISLFFAKLTGKSTYTVAKKQTIDYAKSLDQVAKSANSATLGIDELNIVSQETGSSSAAGGAVTGGGAFEEVAVPDTTPFDEVAKRFQMMKDKADAWKQSLNFEPLLGSFERLKTSIDPLLGKTSDGLEWLLEHILLPLGSWTIEEAAPAGINMMASAFEVLDTVLTVLQPTFDYIWEHILQPIGEWTGDKLVGALDYISELFGRVADSMNENGEEINGVLTKVGEVGEFLWSGFLQPCFDNIIEGFKGVVDMFFEKGDELKNIFDAIGKAFEIVWELSVKPTLQFFKGGLKTFFDYCKRIIGDVIDVFNGLADFFIGVFTGDWERAWNGIKEIFAGVWDAIKDVCEGAVNIIIDGINSISFDVPDWVPFVGGKHFGFNIPRADFTSKAGKTQVGTPGRIKPGVNYRAFADGGFPEDGWFRAAHGEYFGQFDDGTSVISNNKQIEGGISAGVERAVATLIPYLSELVSSNNTIADKDYSVSIGDREIARAAQRGQHSMGMRIITT